MINKRIIDILQSARKTISRINLITIILLALVLRVVWLLYTQPIPVSDFEEYRQLAFNLLSYHQFGYPAPTAYRLPGYPIFLALFSSISRSNLWLGFINVLLSTLIVYLVYLLAIRLTSNQSIGLGASFIAAVYPILVFFSPILASEHLFTVFVYSGLLLLLSEANRKKRYLTLTLAGVLFGIATLTRGEAIYYVPVIAILGFLPYVKEIGPEVSRSFTTRIASLLLLFLAWGVMLVPWYLRNQVVIGRGAGLSTSGGIMFYYGHHDETRAWQGLLSVENLGSGEVERSATAFQKGLNYIFTTPFLVQAQDKIIESLRLYAPNAYPVFWSAALPGATDGKFQQKNLPGKAIFNFLAIAGYLVVGAMALLSLLFIKSYPTRLWITILGFAFLNLVGYAILFAATSRYRYTIEGFLCILAACFIHQIYRLVAQRKSFLASINRE